jgi:transposase InsO family protein
MSMQGNLSIERMCQLAGVSRTGFYRSLQENQPVEEDMEVRSTIQLIFAEHKRRYGYRRVSAELRRRGMLVNHKRVARLMREDNLLSLRARPFVPRTSDSRHGFAIRPNLARSLRPSGLDQLWVADITYVRLAEDFVYLAVVIDAFSRKVVGWALAGHLEASLALEALDQALAARQPPPESLIHHSDRGVQYACSDYVERLEAREIAVSMSRPGNPYDNAKAESFMKTLKTEEVNGKAYANIDDARRQIGAFIETIYNRQRLHSALGYKPPVEFEAGLRPVAPTPNQDEALSLN